MRVAALFSGGKDSTLAAWVAENHGWHVTHLVTVRPRSDESWMFHVPNLNVTPLIAEAWGKPLVTVETAGEPEAELGELEEALVRLQEEAGIEGFVAGAIASEYQRTRLEGVGHRAGLKSFTPLWHKSGEAVLETLLHGGWDVRLSAVAAEGLTGRHLGARLDRALADDLARLRDRYGVHVAGEGGEYESLVLDAPFFRSRVVVDEADAMWQRDHGRWLVREAHVEPRRGQRPESNS